MKAFTFLGSGKYENTTYIKHDGSESCQTALFPLAVAELYRPDKVITFITPKVKEAKEADLTTLTKELGEKFTTVDIPNGNSTEELWDIFTKCVDAEVIEENDEIILDITHAFRSIPLLIFIVAAYLRQVKNVELKHIIYGAFEARDQEKNQTPIFDLTPFVELLDWMNAFTIFQRSGDARPIAALNVDKKVKGVLNSLSNALLTNRTFEAQKAAMQFNSLLFDEAKQPPFQMLIDQLQQNYQRMAVNEPSKNLKQSLKAQYLQIKWYMENQHYLQAITLIREWFISWKCIREGEDNWLNAEKRQAIEEKLNHFDKNQDGPFAKLDTTMHNAVELWHRCKIRNDLAHCGMRYKPETAEQAIQKIKELFQEFEKFVRQQNL